MTTESTYMLNLAEKLDESYARVRETVLAKNHDYGSAYQRHGVAGILVRLSDKALRLENLQGHAALVVDESARDTLLDIAGYALLGMTITEDTTSC